jgi:DNA-binding HxlR family transcriptional regulator
LTHRGETLAALVVGLVDWSRAHKNGIEASQAAFDMRRDD